MAPEDLPINLDDATDIDVAATEAFCRETLAAPFAYAHGIT